MFGPNERCPLPKRLRSLGQDPLIIKFDPPPHRSDRTGILLKEPSRWRLVQHLLDDFSGHFGFFSFVEGKVVIAFADSHPFSEPDVAWMSVNPSTPSTEDVVWVWSPNSADRPAIRRRQIRGSCCRCFDGRGWCWLSGALSGCGVLVHHRLGAVSVLAVLCGRGRRRQRSRTALVVLARWSWVGVVAAGRWSGDVVVVLAVAVADHCWL